MRPIKLVVKELETLKKHVTQEELKRLNFDTIDGWSPDGDCFYGQLTGSPDSLRALELICLVTETVICNDHMRDGEMVGVGELMELRDNYGKIWSVSKKWYVEEDGEDIVGESASVIAEQLTVITKKRSQFYLSPLELYVPFLKDQDRFDKLLEIRTILGV